MASPVANNALHTAARETMHIAREAKSPLLERLAIVTMITSAVTGIGFAALHAWHLFRRDLKDEQRERERQRERRTEASSPPERLADAGSAAAVPPHPAHDGDERKWTRREEHADHAQARHR